MVKVGDVSCCMDADRGALPVIAYSLEPDPRLLHPTWQPCKMNSSTGPSCMAMPTV